MSSELKEAISLGSGLGNLQEVPPSFFNILDAAYKTAIEAQSEDIEVAGCDDTVEFGVLQVHKLAEQIYGNEGSA